MDSPNTVCIQMIAVDFRARFTNTPPARTKKRREEETVVFVFIKTKLHLNGGNSDFCD